MENAALNAALSGCVERDVVIANSNTYRRRPRRSSKLFRVLSAFAEGHSYNRFEAERSLNDHTLHSTVSAIQEFGIRVDREYEEVPCLGGRATTRVRRYWLDEEQREIAQLLLGVNND